MCAVQIVPSFFPPTTKMTFVTHGTIMKLKCHIFIPPYLPALIYCYVEYIKMQFSFPECNTGKVSASVQCYTPRGQNTFRPLSVNGK